MRRRDGQPIEIDVLEGKAMAAQLRSGATIEDIAKLHGLPRVKVVRRLWTLNAFVDRPA